MEPVNPDLSKLLKPYKPGIWVALNRKQTRVLASAETFAKIADKVKDRNRDEVILTAVMPTDTYCVGSLNS